MKNKISMATDSSGDLESSAVCVECGTQSKHSLFRKFTGGTIQLSQCDCCNKVLDKYVEFDSVILLLDVLLLRIQSYRHLIFNYGITFSMLWKFSIVLVLCEAYTKLRMLGIESTDSVVLQIHYHSLLLKSIVELLSLLAISFILVKIVATTSANTSCFDVFRVVVISSFGKLSAVAAMVWAGDVYLWLPIVLVLPVQFQALRAALSGISMARAAFIVLVQNILLHGLSNVLEVWRTPCVAYFT